jgi:hypothetical protein
MSTKSTTARAPARTADPATSAAAGDAPAQRARVTKTDTLIALMRAEGGATAQALAEAVGWQVHSVRGFIAGTLKKRADLGVTTERKDGATRYRVTDVAAADHE